MHAGLPSIQGIPELPVPPGESVFHVKGSVYAGLFARIARELPDGVTRVRAALSDRALRAFVDQLFLAAGWYDALPLVPLLATIAQLKGVSFEQEVSHGARIRATEDINSVYRIIFRLASPALVAPRLVRGLGKYFDFGRAEDVNAGAGAIGLLIHDVPAFFAPWFVHGSETFFRVALELAGARAVQVTWRPAEPAGERGGLPLLRLRSRVEWR